MKPLRSVRPSELTPDARIDSAKRAIANAIDDLVEAKIAKGMAASDWVDQHISPLGKRRHLMLFKDGKIRGVREGHRVLVRRKDIDDYLESRGEQVRAVEAADDDVDALMQRIAGGAKR